MAKMNEGYRADKDEKYRCDPEVVKTMDKALKDGIERERNEDVYAIVVIILLLIIIGLTGW